MSEPTGTEAEVCADIAKRQALGIAKYGVTVAENPLPLREWLEHAYQETLDQAVYLKRAIQEIDAENDPYSTPEYQGFLAECSKHCRCTHRVCDGVLAGGLCDMIIEDDRDEERFDREDA